ncbi:hypothetical protein F2P81_007458 [Scophthalmus maximus]|uniref:Uncharacterized protein n=1 Tax=Scophthalmus maximus TaxID=52904 RepID=A0A6A4SZF7_SCOMX|nr:hypothetical protein F2P81_007458 [Scophthalmus maximus]
MVQLDDHCLPKAYQLETLTPSSSCLSLTVTARARNVALSNFAFRRADEVEDIAREEPLEPDLEALSSLS